MGKIVFIIGDSGTGKSTSIRNLDPESTYIINVFNKDLPFRGSAKSYRVKSDKHRGNLFVSNDPNKIIRVIEGIGNTRPEIKTLIIDDFGLIIGHEMMKSALIRGYDKFVLMAQAVDNIIEMIQTVRNDLYVFITWHTELAEDGKYKIKASGKMIENYIKPESKASIVLHTMIRDGRYFFITNNDGIHMSKSPMKMFDDLLIENDLQYVIEKMNDYYNVDLETL